MPSHSKVVIYETYKNPKGVLNALTSAQYNRFNRFGASSINKDDVKNLRKMFPWFLDLELNLKYRTFPETKPVSQLSSKELSDSLTMWYFSKAYSRN